MKRFAFIILAVTLCCCLPEKQSFARSLYWQDMTVEATLTDEGRLLVREKQTIVFTGAWNGGERTFFIAPGQTFSFTGISRETNDGEIVPLKKGNLKRVDHWDWASADTLRWRSRLPGDPPFSATPLTFILEYRLGHILILQDDGSFRLNHDFAFPNRSGEIRNFRLTLHFGEQWLSDDSPLIIEKQHIAPGHSVIYTTDLLHTDPGMVESYRKPLIPINVAGAATKPAPGWLSWGGGTLLLALLLLASAGFYRHERQARRFSAAISPDDIDEQWLEENVFSLLPETVGATWDKTTDGHEVAAVLARLVVEGKMTSRLEEHKLPIFGFKLPGTSILHLELQQSRSHFKDYERSLIDGFFIDGDATDTKKIRQYYRQLGKAFRPAEKIRWQLKQQVKKLTESAGNTDQTKWFYVALVALLGLVLIIINGFVHVQEVPFTVLGAIFGVFGTIIGMILSQTYKSRSDRLLKRSIKAHLSPLLAVLLYTFLGLLGISALLTLGLVILYSTLIITLFALARTTDSAGGVALRQRLTAAREYLQKQLRQKNPAIKDEWFPYLLAFGLGPNVDKWTKQFSDRSGLSATGSTFHSSSSSGSGFTGGGGRFGGAGASGAWAVAATALGTSASSSSSGSSGGGGGSSGGGGGGGW